MSTLHTLLDRSLGLPPEYGTGLTTHLPMALHALAELGADDDRLSTFFDHYARRFGAERAGRAAPLPDWTTALGRIDAFDALRAGFDALIARDGALPTLRAALPRLWPGVAAAAFHGAIRSAHALQTGHPGELAAALAYWAASWKPLPPGLQGVALSFAAWSDRLEAAALRSRPAGGLISQRMTVVSSGDDYWALAETLPAGAASLRDLSAWAARVYAGSGNFTVLHMVTGCRAARVLLAADDDPAAAWPHLCRAFVAAALAARLEPPQPAPQVPAVAGLKVGAIASDDDHVIKLVHAALDETTAWGDGPWLAAAARALVD
jgi:Questin oxidase-like